MNSREREELLVKLAPLLYSSDGFITAKDRTLPDAFTDALYPSNAEAPLRPPAKWKIVCITVASLFLVVFPTSLHLPRVLARMGVVNVYAQTPILVSISVFINTYALNPLVTRIVGHWLLQPRSSLMDIQPWKFFDQGFGISRWSNWGRLAFALAYYVPLLITWASNNN